MFLYRFHTQITNPPKINLDPESMSRVSRITFRKNKNTGISTIEIVRDLIVVEGDFKCRYGTFFDLK